MITWTEAIKGYSKCKIFVLSYLFGDLGVTYRVHLWLDENIEPWLDENIEP